MQSEFKLCIVLPCYNESENFLFSDYFNFINGNLDILLCFVNDGSTDESITVLNSLKERFPSQIEIISNIKRQGKAESVRKGFLHCEKTFEYKYIAYLDVDLAVSLDECSSFVQYLNEDIVFCFGSRILRIGSVIERKRSRFLIGRIIATFISIMLKLKVYDTQCGCKVFKKEISSKLFNDPFISKWLFDVEIFFRILHIYGKEMALSKMLEIPLKKWIERGNSKVKLNYFTFLWIDLFKIRKKYK